MKMTIEIDMKVWRELTTVGKERYLLTKIEGFDKGRERE